MPDVDQPGMSAGMESGAERAPVILGRAWIDRQGGVYDHNIGEETRQWLNGPREVLLVPLAAGKVLEAVGPAVHRWRHGMPDLYDEGPEQPGDVEEALAAAWDALVGDRPEPAGDNDRDNSGREIDSAQVTPHDRADTPEPPGPPPATVLCGCGVRIIHATADGYGRDGCDDPTPEDHHQLHEAVAEAERQVEELQDRLTTARAELHWASQPSPAPVAADLTGPVTPGHPTKDGAGYDCSCGECQSLRAEPVPVPDNGGWNRVWLLDCMLPHLPAASYNEPDLHDEAQRQITALLADRDRQSAEVAHIKVAWSRMQEFRDQNADGMIALIGKLRAEVERLRTEVDAAWEAAGDMAALEEAVARDRAEVVRLGAELERQAAGFLESVNILTAEREKIRRELADAETARDWNARAVEENQRLLESARQDFAVIRQRMQEALEIDADSRPLPTIAEMLERLIVDAKSRFRDDHELCDQQLREARGGWRETAEELAEVKVERHDLREQRDAARTALEQAAAEQAAHEGELGDMRSQLSATEAEVDRLERVVAAEHASHAESRSEVERRRYENEALRAKLATARRDAAAGALEWCADAVTDPCSGDLSRWAAEIRDGKFIPVRTIPVSEPAEDGGAGDGTHA